MHRHNKPIDVSALYKDVERHVMPIIRSAARKLVRQIGGDEDDAVQEGRIALLQALESYDYNASHGGIYNYARTSVRNAMYALLFQALTRRRMPHFVVEENGESKLVRSWPMPMEDFECVQAEQLDPEERAAEGELLERFQILKVRLLSKLNARQREVFKHMTSPSGEFATMMRNMGVAEADEALIAAHMNVSKNVIDWSVHRIKQHFTTLVEEEFSEFIQKAIQEGKWPMFHVSPRDSDADFIRGIIRSKSLDPRPVQPPSIQTTRRGGVRFTRTVEKYAWGSVIFARMGEEAVTVLAEGRFNAISGEVLSPTGCWKTITEHVPWYPKLARALQNSGIGHG
jgi:RNA polymerase sigma factor (sigma-70 family)